MSDKRHADRLKAVYLLGSGWTLKAVAEALLIDDDTVRNYFKRYQNKGLSGLVTGAVGGSEAWLNEAQQQALVEELQTTLYLTAKAVAAHVEKTFGIRYSERGMTHLLHRLGFVYKQPEIVPGKADPEAQKAFLETLENVKKDKQKQDPIYYMDAVHPQHNVVPAYGWIQKGGSYRLPSNTGRRRLNINGAINVESLTSIVRYDDTINADSTLRLFEQLEAHHPEADTIYVICDNARYYRSKKVKEYLKRSRITLLFLPPYSPNLNLIERYWKFFKKEVLYGTYYETFDEFEKACNWFFENTDKFKDQLRSLLTEKFHIIQPVSEG